jgi:tripartite-type tricarboxylate transporter receptor subunit TctC
MLAQKLAEQVGGTFVVENRPGAAGVLGAELVARSAPDGHMLSRHRLSSPSLRASA